MERKLGLLKIKRKLPFNKWAEEVRKNIEYGKNKHAELQEIIRIQHNEQADQLANNRISSLANDLVKYQNMEIEEAQKKAQKMYFEETKMKI